MAHTMSSIPRLSIPQAELFVFVRLRRERTTSKRIFEARNCSTELLPCSSSSVGHCVRRNRPRDRSPAPAPAPAPVIAPPSTLPRLRPPQANCGDGCGGGCGGGLAGGGAGGGAGAGPILGQLLSLGWPRDSALGGLEAGAAPAHGGANG